MNHPLISIVLCTYNGEAFLKEQLNSLLAQTWPALEIIVSDDCSTDGTKDILRQYESNPLLHIFFQPNNLGPVKNFGFAASQAQGAYIAFCDQDDIWLPGKIEKLYAAISNAPLVYADSELVDEQGNSLNKKISDLRCMYSGDDSRGFVFSNVVWGHAMMVTAALLQQSLPVPDKTPHDIWLAVKAVTNGGIKYLDEVLVKYRQHSKTVTTTIAHNTVQRSVSKRYADYLEKLHWMELILANERESYKSFYTELINLYGQKSNGAYVWPLFFFLLKHRKAMFSFSQKSAVSQFIEITKQARGEKE